MKTFAVIFGLALAAAVFIHMQQPKWLAEHLPDITAQSPAFEAAPLLGEHSPWIAGFGRVEPVSRERHLAFDITGLLREVHVEEGDLVRAGQVLATLENDEHRAKFEAAEAEAKAQKAQYDKMVAGARKEKKSEAWSAVLRLKSVMDNARIEMKRRKKLLSENLIAKEEADRAAVDFRVAEKEYEEAVQRHLVTKNQSRKEDIASSWARYNAARKTADEARSQLEKTRLRTPLDGRVLKIHRRSGENVSIFFESPVLTVADDRKFQIRAEIDEKYAAQVKKGQQAFFTSEALGNRRLEGTVRQVGALVGDKTIDMDDPQDKSDTKVIEVVIRLREPEALFTGLTGDVFIETDKALNTVRAEANQTIPATSTTP